MRYVLPRRTYVLALVLSFYTTSVGYAYGDEPSIFEVKVVSSQLSAEVKPVSELPPAPSLQQSSPVGGGGLRPQADTARGDRSVGRGTGRLKGAVSVSEQSTLVGQRIDELLDAALDNDVKSKELEQAVMHFRSLPTRAFTQGKDATDFVIHYRGFAPSSEAGDIITGEKLKLKSRSAAEYARQKQIDEAHMKVVSSVMQMAMGLGMSDQSRGQQIVAQELRSLRDLVGGHEADRTVLMLSEWSKQLTVPDSAFTQNVWDVSQRREKFTTVAKSALSSDPVVLEIQNRLHKYNHRSKFARASGHIFETVFGVMAQGPLFVGTAGEVGLVSFVMATGGPEQTKITKELYLDRRFESRSKVVTEETHLALENYQLAVLTRNPVLLACSEALIDQMAGPETISQVFGSSVLKPKSDSVTPGIPEGLAAGPAEALK